MKPRTVLSVEDNEDDQMLLQRAWRKAGVPVTLHIASDGEKAIDYLAGRQDGSASQNSPLPAMILLDLKMPRKNGFEVLEWMSRQPPPQRVPVAVFTSSQNTEDIKRAYDMGARWYLVKPVDYTNLTEWVRSIGPWFDDPASNDLSRSIHYRPPISR